MSSKRALVLGAGGFIGSHMVKRLKQEAYFVRGADAKHPEFSPTAADDYRLGDLQDFNHVQRVIDGDFDEIYQFAAEMGGAGYIFTGENDADIMSNSAGINLNLLNCLKQRRGSCVFYASSACIYPTHNQTDPRNPKTDEASAYPADPDSDYGWEKLFSERLYAAFARNYGLQICVARYHNIFGPEGVWQGGREKAPAALCRKIAMANDGDDIEIWGDGEQTRSFLYIDECLEGTLRLTRSAEAGPLNIGSAETVSINDLALMIARIAGKTLNFRHSPGPLGVRGRTSDNALIRERLGWEPSAPLKDGLQKTYRWIEAQIKG